MKKIQDERLLRKIFFVFLIIQPILDCYLLYTDAVIGFFHFSPTTIIRLLIIAFLFILLFFNRRSIANLKIIGIYGGVLLAYILAHHFIASGIDNSGYKTFSYSFVTEMFYIIRMLLPIAVIFITYKLKPTKEEVIKLFLIVSAAISVIIVGSNIIMLSRTSYGSGFIKANVFHWFFNTEFMPKDLASKGWFNSANQISGLMYILFPICLYSLTEKITKSRLVITFMTMLSMIMLGTRVASYGWALMIVMVIVLYLFFTVIKKIKFEGKKFGCLFVLLALGCLIMTHAPIVNTGTVYNEDEKLQKMKDGKVSTKKMLKYIGMNEIYYEEIYPYEEHEDFWEYVVYDVPATQRVGNRNSQQLITDDVAATYETVLTSTFGIGYSRFINAYLYLEKDFVVQYHTIGIVGILLFLVPYIIIAGYYAFRKLKEKSFALFNSIMLAVLILPLCISYFSGHIVDELIITIYLGFIAGYLLSEGRKEKENGES